MHILKTKQQIVEHISRHTILTVSSLLGEDRELIMMTINQLVRSRHLSEWRHESGLPYWTLFSENPLSNHSLVRALGLLLFCQETKTRSPITRDDIRDYFPQLFRHGLPRGYFVELVQQQAQLGYAKIDCCSRISRIVSRSLKIVDQHRSHSAFRELIDEERFAITWIVATQAKQRRLINAFRFIQASGIKLRVHSIRELLEIASPIPPFG